MERSAARASGSFSRRRRWRVAMPSWMDVACSAYWMLLLCATATLANGEDPTTFVIDATTKLQDVFQLTIPPAQNTSSWAMLSVRDTVLDGAALAPLAGVHVELLFDLDPTRTAMSIANATIQASAVVIHALDLTLDSASSMNVSARGLKFGPGFNSRYDMGGSYGGLGGASLTPLHQSCERIRPNEFFRSIGDVSGDLSDFQGYGSGGGNDKARGGGRIEVNVAHDAILNGSVLANGGAACTDCSDSAGAGGTIIIKAGERIYGQAIVHANGGEPAVFDDDQGLLGEGGGGGGGGGRIVFESKHAEELDPAHVEAFGGGLPGEHKNDVIKWCQLGGDGTILKLQHSVQDGYTEVQPGDDDPPATLISTLVVKGGRLTHEGPAKRVQIYGCTPIYYQSSSWLPFLPDSLAHIFVSGGATLCTSYIELKVSGKESILVYTKSDVVHVLRCVIVFALAKCLRRQELFCGKIKCLCMALTAAFDTNNRVTIAQTQLDAGSELIGLEGNRSVHIVASQFTLQGFVGPSTQTDRDLFILTLEGTDVSISNALLMVSQLDVQASGSFHVDKYSVIKFRWGVLALAGGPSAFEGFLEPLTPPDLIFEDTTPAVRLESKNNVDLRPQTAQLGAMHMHVKAGATAVVDMPFDTPFLSLSVVAKNATILHANSGSVPKCEPIKYQVDELTCKTLAGASLDHSPYVVSVFASQVAVLGNISAGAILLCSDDTVIVQGTISAAALGCSSGFGLGNSTVNAGASGGAGHGGRGGNVQPGNTGGGAWYDISADVWETSVDRVALLAEALPKWPTWPGSGAASGDTPDQIVGGNGGGVIYIGSTKLNVLKGATISARGGNGFKRGGGGSGGSVVMHISAISGSGVIDLEGGEAVNPSGHRLLSEVNTKSSVWNQAEPPLAVSDEPRLGGGGGGGIVRIVYRQVKDLPNNGEQFVEDGGKLSVQGGKSIGGENGANGIMVASNCVAGRGDVFCLECAEGSYSPGNYSRCIPCEPGSCSSHTGAPSCDKCTSGMFNGDFGKKACVPCPVGHFSAAEGAKVCAPCGPGHFAATAGSASCALCPIGTISTSTGSINCTVCDVGETTLKLGSTKCSACHDKPAHSQFNVRGNCTYACDKGRNGLDCLTPFERLVKPIGGPLGFVILVFSLTFALFGAWGFISYRSSQYKKRRFAEYKAQTLRDQLSLAKLTRNLTPRLTDQDLDAHLARLHFTGDNHFESSWVLNASFLPMAMRDIVYEGAYLSFTSRCNDMLRWDTQNWEAWLYRLLFCSVPPLGTLFKRRRQLRRVEKLAKYVEDHGASFFREMNFRVHGAKLKIGFSPDFSLAYIDVLVPPGVSSLSLLDARHTGSLTIVVAGSGSFFRPYHIDTNDIIVRAVPSRLELLKHDFWINFVADINQKLRVIPQPTSLVQLSESAHAVNDVLEFVSEFNRRHESDGFMVQFGSFSVESAINAESNESCFMAWETTNAEEMLLNYGQEPFKFAFQVKRTWEEEGAASGDASRHVEDLDGIESSPAFEYEGESLRPLLRGQSSLKNDAASLDPRPAEFRFSQIRMEALFANSDSLSPRDGAAGATHTLLSPTSKKRSNGAHSSSARNALAALVSRKSMGRILALLQPLSPLFRLYNVNPPKASTRAWYLPMTLVLLLVLDIALAFWILMEYYCIQVEDPTSTDSGCSRFAVWNVGAIVNVFVAFISGLMYISFIHEGVLAVIVALIVVKYAEKEIVMRCIAQYASERPLRGWRGLYTTKDWYDSAYTPLVHQES
ncbi:hypothetical protein FI667_g5727, partial [Globisporangium splendens]